jgi:hypothetical protein
VLERQALQRPQGRSTLDPAPLLVVEVLSTDTRRRDPGEKADAYHAGGAVAYWTVELRPRPRRIPAACRAQTRVIGRSALEPLVGTVEIDTPFAVLIDLDRLTLSLAPVGSPATNTTWGRARVRADDLTSTRDALAGVHAYVGK